MSRTDIQNSLLVAKATLAKMEAQSTGLDYIFLRDNPYYRAIEGDIAYYETLLSAESEPQSSPIKERTN